jgi:hypothetical protein
MRLTTYIREMTVMLLATTVVVPVAHATETRSEDTLETLREVFFPRTVQASGLTRAFRFLDDGYPFESLEAVNRYNVEAGKSAQNSSVTIELPDFPIESPWWWGSDDSQATIVLMRQLVPRLRDELAMRAPMLSHERTGLDKALAQRDSFHIFHLVSKIANAAKDEETRRVALEIKRLTAMITASLAFTRREYRELVAMVPRNPDGFVAIRPGFNLVPNYLPLRAVADDDSWAEIPAIGRPFAHFVAHDGRNFNRVFIRIPNSPPSAVTKLWRALFAEHGLDLHAVSTTTPAPVGMETLFVRTIGVFLSDGQYVDTRWPEEVTMRIFKYPDQTLDKTTSDFRGTLFYQYKLSRAALLKNPRSLGLRRISDDAPQFAGLLGDVPTRRGAYTNGVTTMRANCIACHEELFYGVNTVFSFGRNPAWIKKPYRADDPTFDSEIAYRQKADHFVTLRSMLAEFRSGVSAASGRRVAKEDAR